MLSPPTGHDRCLACCNSGAMLASCLPLVVSFPPAGGMAGAGSATGPKKLSISTIRFNRASDHDILFTPTSTCWKVRSSGLGPAVFCSPFQRRHICSAVFGGRKSTTFDPIFFSPVPPPNPPPLAISPSTDPSSWIFPRSPLSLGQLLGLPRIRLFCGAGHGVKDLDV